MKITILLSLLAFFLFSCTASKDPVVGVWTCAKISPSGESQQTVDLTSVVMEKPIDVSRGSGVQELITYDPEAITTIKLKGNKTATLISETSSSPGTWEVNQASNTLDITLKETQKVIQFKFAGNNQNTLIMDRKLNNGEFEVHYRKKK
ncbi:MAG: hypothetical protein D4R67_03570 [Bacteroidetes bacterium]|nr:MAG: hypothetical protein D4R67_03570 [Bacteroidota bacterium]